MGWQPQLALQRLWYQRSPWILLLLPLSGLFCLLVWLRRKGYALGVFPSYALDVPVLVVGNITVGGTGKTPLVAWIAEYLQTLGYQPGIVSRGYGGKAQHWPQQVRPDSDPVMVGDEAVLLARQCHCPMAVGPDRVATAQSLVEHHQVDIVISDDGLQHYALRRDVEIAVIDGVRRFGTGYCLPAGPLRESMARLKQVDLLVANGLGGRLEYPMHLRPGDAYGLEDDTRKKTLKSFAGSKVHAVAGIGNPQRFFDMLKKQGLEVIPHAFADHHDFQPGDLQLNPSCPILMTEKDAVKCRRFAQADQWVVPVRAELDERFREQLTRLLEPLLAEYKARRDL